MPATTWALVTTTFGATTKPVPSCTCPHPTPCTFTVDGDAARAAARRAGALGSVTGPEETLPETHAEHAADAAEDRRKSEDDEQGDDSLGDRPRHGVGDMGCQQRPDEEPEPEPSERQHLDGGAEPDAMDDRRDQQHEEDDVDEIHRRAMGGGWWR